MTASARSPRKNWSSAASFRIGWRARLLRSIPGVAEINSTGGYVKQYQVLVDPMKMRYYSVTIQDVHEALARNNANSSGGILPQGPEMYLVRGIGLIKDLDDIRSMVLKEVAATPVYIRDVAEVRFGEEVRYGAMIKGGYTRSRGRHRHDDRGRQCEGDRRNVSRRAWRRSTPRTCCRTACKSFPTTTGPNWWTRALDRRGSADGGIVLVIVVLFLFLGDLRSSLVVIATLVLTPLLTFLVMNSLRPVRESDVARAAWRSRSG